MSKISTLHQSFVSVIPDRFVTSDRPSTRSRLFGFAKHKSQKSSGIVGDVVRKREEVGENVCEDKENVRPSFRRSRALTVTPFSRGANARNRACAVAEVESMKPPVSNLHPKLESQAIKVNDDHGGGVLAARTPFASVANTDAYQSSDLVQQDTRKSAKRGRSPERPKAMQYKRRYSVALRGLTPSPTRPTKDSDAMDVDSSPRARAAEIEEEELMTSPVRRNFRLARRPPTPCRSVALVRSRPIVDEKPLPLTFDQETVDKLPSFGNHSYTPNPMDEKPCAPLPRGRGRSHTSYSAFRFSFNSIRSSADH